MKCNSAWGRESIRLKQVGGSIEMTTLKKFLGLGMMLAAFAIAGAVPAFAQGCDDVAGYTDSYTKITEGYAKNDEIFKRTKKGDLATLKMMVSTGKDYLQKFGDCPATKDANGNEIAHPAKQGVDWVKVQLPAWEKAVIEIARADDIDRLYKKYVGELGAKNWDGAIATSKELLAIFPADKSLNIYIPMAALGLYESYNKNDKFVDASIQNAKLVLDKIKGGEVALGDYWGIAPYNYGNKDDTVSEMKFILGYLLTTKKADKKGGLTYLYEVAQSPGRNKTEPRLFTTFAAYYVEQGEKVGAELKALQDKIIAADVEIKKEGTTPERITELNKLKIETNNQIVAKEPYYLAWAERAIDAYGRAISSTKGTTPAHKKYRDDLYEVIKGIYAKRFPTMDGIDAFIAKSIAQPLPNPTTDVTPVAAPAAETTTGGAMAVVTKPAVSTAPAKPAETSQTVATKTTAKTTAKSTAKARVKPRR